jgi:hypothetical protein
MDKTQVDSLIWGDFESEIIELQVPLWVGGDEIKSMVMNGAMALFFGFLHFIQFKRGFKPNFGFIDGVSFFESEHVIPDFEDPSWWVNNLEHPDMMGHPVGENLDLLPPNFFIQYLGKNDDEHIICMLFDTFSFFESGRILNETKLNDESKYLFSEISKEFHVRSGSYQSAYALDYFSPKNMDWAHGHTLVFRPSKLVEFLSLLNESLSHLEDFPEQIVRKETWDKMSIVERAGTCGKSELVFCREENIIELVDKYSIKIPDVKFVTFYEYLKNKLDPSISKEWEDIRNRYISNLKKSIVEPHLSNDYSKAKRFLNEARKSFDDKNYNDSTLNSWNGIVKALNIFLKDPKMADVDKIKKLYSQDKLIKYIPKLNYLRSHRNYILAHPKIFEITDMETAKHFLQIADDFLIDIQKTI